MDCFDHYPWSPTDAEHRAMIADICASLGVPPPSVRQTVPIAPLRYVKRGDYMICQSCQLAKEWCACLTRPAAATPSGDARAESDLARRIKDCQGR